MDIKEIALKIADSLRNRVDGISHMQSNQGLIRFAEALIESYKDELLKEAGEPVADVVKLFDHHGYFTHHTVRFADSYKPENGTKLYTSDQVAAAVARATKPLGDQLVAAQEEILIERSNGDHWSDAYSKWVNTDESARRLIELQDQLATAEQRVVEWQPIETAPKDGQLFLAYSTEFVNQYWVTDKYNGMTHWMPLPKAPANGASS